LIIDHAQAAIWAIENRRKPMPPTTAEVADPDDVPVSPARAFWAAWSGWMLDGFDSGLYIFVLLPAQFTFVLT
jgi:hypothetical protein